MRISINCPHHVKLPRKLQKQLKIIAQEIIKKERFFGAKIVIILCSDSYIARLNRIYRQKEGFTDVISFPLVEAEELPEFQDTCRSFLLGEIYISWKRVLLQARQRSVSVSQETKRLCVHGLFHLLGYEHSDENEAWHMRIRERKFLRSLQYRLWRRLI